VPAFGPFLAALRAPGVGQALEAYRAGRQARPSEPAIDEETMNRIRVRPAGGKKVRTRSRCSSRTVADHPESWNVFDSLGSLRHGREPALAIQAYERSLQLKPGDTGGAERLKKLRAAAGRD